MSMQLIQSYASSRPRLVGCPEGPLQRPHGCPILRSSKRCRGIRPIDATLSVQFLFEQPVAFPPTWMNPRRCASARLGISSRTRGVAKCAFTATATCMILAPAALAHASRTNRPSTLHVATWNLRGVMDRWAERKPLLLSCLSKYKELDVVGLQEVMTGGFGQDKLIRDSMEGEHRMFACRTILEHLDRRFTVVGGAYKFFISRCVAACMYTKRSMVALLLFVEGLREHIAFQPAKTFQFFKNFLTGTFTYLGHLLMSPFFGNAIICKEAINGRNHSMLALGDFRVAQKVVVTVPPSEMCVVPLDMLIVNVHLHHGEDELDVEIRTNQIRNVLDWIKDWREMELAGVILMGDFNAPPTEKLHAMLREEGYRSSYASVHGSEPEKTFPSGLQAPLMDVHGEAACLDFIYSISRPDVDLRVLDSCLLGNQHAKGDDTLYPSDHFGIQSLFQVSVTSNE